MEVLHDKPVSLHKRSMSKLDWFSLVSGCIGLAANLIFFFQLFSGSISFPQPTAFLNPYSIAGVSLFIVLYSMLTLLVFIALKAAKRWHRDGKELTWLYDEGLVTITRVIYIPTSIVWCLSMLRLFTPANLPFDGGDIFLVILFLGGTIYFVPPILANVAERIRRLLDPSPIVKPRLMFKRPVPRKP